MADIKISQLPVASVVNDNDIAVINQGGDTKTAAKSLIVAGLATTDQISAFATTSQVESIASAQIAAITPASIGAFATSAVIGIGNGGTGATDAPSALAALGGITSAQVPAFDSAQLSAYVQKAGSTMEGRLIMAATTAQAKANIGGALAGVAAPTSSIAGDVWISNQSRLTFSPSTGTAVTLAGLSQQNTFNQQQTIGSATAATGLIVSNTSTGRAATFAAASTAPAVAITQTGVGEAFRVEDETSPDATPFVISSAGRVGIGVTPDAVTALAVDSGGIKFSDGSIQTTAVGSFSTAQLSGYATTTDIQGIAFTSQLSGFATTDQISGFTTSAQVEAISDAQISLITPASIGAVATGDVIQISQGGTGEVTSTAALVALGGMPLNQAAGGDLSGTYPDPSVVKLRGYDISVNAPFGGAILQWIGTEWTPASPPSGSVTSVGTGAGLTGGPITSDGVIALETTGVAALTYGSATQVAVLDVNQFGQITSASNSAITPAGIGALSTDAASGFATTSDIQGIAFTSQLSAFATTDQLSGYATTTDIQGIAFTSQLSSFTNSAQVEAVASAQIAASTPGSIGAVATSDIIAITHGGTGSTSAAAALTTLGALSATAAAGGDLSGNYPDPTVAKIQGQAVSSAAPGTGQVLTWNGSTWIATAPAAGGSGGGGVLFYFNNGTNADAPAPSGAKELGRTAEVTLSSVTTGTLTSGVWTDVAGFVSDTLDPNLEFLPAGIFDFNVWCNGTANTNAPTVLRVQVNKWDGTTSTNIATSGNAVVSNNGTPIQTAISLVIPQTDITPTDRLYIVIQVQASANGHTVTVDFGDGAPSHVHTTIPSVGGTGVLKLINGVPQNPASFIIDADIATDAAISLSKLAMSEVSVLTENGLTGGGDLSTSRLLSLTTTGVSALSYGSSTQVAALTVDAYGRITAASDVAISASGIGAQPALTSAAPAAIEQGGTGATTAVAALSNLGGISSSALEGYATTGQLSGFATTSQLSAYQPALTSAAPAAIEQGGTGATTAVAALNNLGGITSAALSGYASTSQLAGLQTALTSAAPLAISQGGTGAITGDDALKNLGSSLHYVTLRTGNAQTPLAVSGSYTATWSTGSTTVTLATGNTSLFSQGNTFGTGGLAGAAIISITNSTQFVVSANPSTTQTTAAAITVFATTPTTFTYAPGVQPPNDGYSTVVGDVIAFGSQTPTPTNGPWVCTVAGAVGVSQVMTRPAWFAGSAAAILVQSLKGNTSQGNIAAFTSATASNNNIQVGLQGLGSHLIYQRGNVPTLTTNTFTGRQTFAANTATVNPFSFSASTTQLSAITPHAVEWDGTQMYVSNLSSERLPVATSKALINAQTNTTYTVTDIAGGSDAGKLITASNPSPITISIPTDATVNANFPIGTQILVMQLGAGQVTVSAVTPGTTAVNSKNGTKTSGQYAVISLIKVAANSWVVGGDATT